MTEAVDKSEVPGGKTLQKILGYLTYTFLTAKFSTPSLYLSVDQKEQKLVSRISLKFLRQVIKLGRQRVLTNFSY